MAVSIFPGKRPFNIVWNVGKIQPSVSSAFSLENSKWCFVLETESNRHHNDEDWKMYLRKIDPKEGNHAFLISIYFEDTCRKLECLNFTRLVVTKPGVDLIMWRRKSNIKQKYPDFDIDGDNTFVITLLYDHKHMSDIENHTDSKSTQTPGYMEIHPCLERLSTDFRKLADRGSEPDMELHCGGHTLHVHRAILIARSEVFAAMIQSDMLEKRRSSIDIVDMEFTILEHFLRYLYAGTLPPMNIDTATGLYQAADKYDVEVLKIKCSLFLKEQMTVENACRLLVLADAHCDNELKDCVMSYMIRNDILMYMDHGKAFCALYPKLALDVLHRAYKTMRLSMKSSN